MPTQASPETEPDLDSPPNVSLPVFAEPKPRRSRRSTSTKTTTPPPFLVDEEETGEQVLTLGPSVRGGRVVGSASSSRQDIPTEGSSAGTTERAPATRKQAQNTSKLVKGLLKMAVVVVEAVMKRAGREFRRPEEHQLDGVAQPLARVAVRHLDVSYISDDLMDLTEAGGALSDYILDGPVAPRMNYVEQVGYPIEPEPPAPVVNTSIAASGNTPQRETPPEPWLLAESPAARPGVEKPDLDPNARVSYRS